MSTDSLAMMTDDALISALRATDPQSPDLSDLLVEMWRRGLREAEDYGQALMATGKLHLHPDNWIYDVVEVMLSQFDEPCEPERWLVLQSYGWKVLDTLMILALRTNPDFGYKVLDLAEREGTYSLNAALLSILATVPIEDAALPACLMKWARDRRTWPNTQCS